MYHEEKTINGVLCWRGTPDGEFVAYTAEQLTSRIESINRNLDELSGDDLPEMLKEQAL